jgi:signal transduction histidine kinase
MGGMQPNHEQREETFTRLFEKYIFNTNGNIYVNKDGRKILEAKDLWIQILDENVKEVYRYKAPAYLAEKHTPMDLVNGYKYAGGLDNGGADSVLISSKKIGNIEYTYMIGFPRELIEKYIIMYNSKYLINSLSKIIMITIVIDLFIALIFGYIFSRRLTKPMKLIIGGVENLEQEKYDIYYREKGIYRPVYEKLNRLADTLKSNKVERIKIDNMKQEWIANITHDIKTPLSSIKGYAELLSDDYEFDRDEIKQYGNIINKKSNYIKELVDDLNLTMKLKNSSNVLNKKEDNIVRVVKDSIIEILNDPKYSQTNIEFVSKKDVINKDIDKTLIKRVINNLIYNSLIHNDENISIEIEIIKDEKITIYVRDNGKGIKKEDLEKIFDRYYRGTNTGEVHKGSGLGMAIAKEIVNAHDGDIYVSSELGIGTVVKIVL